MKMQGIRREDWKGMFLIGFFGYFLSNMALLTGIKYSNASFSSLINAMCPIFITAFAALLLLDEKLTANFLVGSVLIVAGMILNALPEKAELAMKKDPVRDCKETK